MSEWTPQIRPSAPLPSRDAAERLRVREAAPERLTDAALMAASLAVPQTRPLVALQAALASDTAEAGSVPWGITTQLTNLLKKGEIPPNFARSVAVALRNASKTGREWGAHSSLDLPFGGTAHDELVIPPDVSTALRSKAPGDMFHTHPAYTSAAPSAEDIASSRGRELIGRTDSPAEEFTQYAPLLQKERYKDAPSFARLYAKIKASPQSRDWGKAAGLDDAGMERFHHRTDTLQYMDELERQGRVTNQHQTGTIGDLPVSDLMKSYYIDVLRGKL